MNRCIAYMLLLCLLLAGCGAGPAPESTPPITTTTTVTTTTTQAPPRLVAEGTRRRITGDWRSLLTPATEKEEQIDGYAILKKLRGKEKEYGYVFSATLTGRLTVEGAEYYLCELGHWITDPDGVRRYEVVRHLMVPTDRSAGYAADITGDMTWDTADNWFH